MKINSLLNNQTLQIDNHKWGSGEPLNWDAKHSDIHLDKLTWTSKKNHIRIKVPLNSNRPISIENKSKGLRAIPTQLVHEIKEAFSNKTIRERFINDLSTVLRNYESVLANEEKTRLALESIAKHFGLQSINDYYCYYHNNKIIYFAQKFKDSSGIIKLFTMDRKKITLGGRKRK
jgi:hypothetical protein